ncbi:hypothetical protein CsSME_00042651 [Camellia sinensis var. sinensis]
MSVREIGPPLSLYLSLSLCSFLPYLSNSVSISASPPLLPSFSVASSRNPPTCCCASIGSPSWLLSGFESQPSHCASIGFTTTIATVIIINAAVFYIDAAVFYIDAAVLSLSLLRTPSGTSFPLSLSLCFKSIMV